jgi:hypothetical protein
MRSRIAIGAALLSASVLTSTGARAEPEPDAAEEQAPAEPPAREKAPPPREEPAAPTPNAEERSPPPPPEAAPPVEERKLEMTPIGYIEAYYAYNFNRPSNGITNYRGFDNRHNAFTLANAVLGARAAYGSVATRIVLQIGSTPSTYYAAEPSLAGAAGANATSSELWKYLQEANVSWRSPVGRGLILKLGLLSSPIGFETFAVKDNWNWSRSNLFFGLPFYHAGLQATYRWTDEVESTIAVFNGWNSVVDSNEEKSVQTSVSYRLEGTLLLQALYFGGVERPSASRPEGPWWRHHFDAVVRWDPAERIAFAGQADFGFEPNRIGTARWIAGAVYARVEPLRRVFVAVRGDRFHEHLATDHTGRTSAPLFWGGVEWVTSGTATIEARPHAHLSIRFEYRHDVAASPLYFGRDVRGDGTAAAPYVPNARTQDTLLVGATAWL